MKLVCSQAELNTALQLVSRAVASRPTHPVLANVLLTADEGTNKVSLTGFDLNLGIQSAFTASVETSGAITLPARLFAEIVSRLDNESSIALISDETGEQIELNSLDANYQMRGMSADDFPDLPLVETGTSLKINSQSLLKALKGTLFASSSDEAKQLLTGVHLRFDGQSMEAAATDGHRLAVLNLSEALDVEKEESSEDTFAFTLPSKSLREVERLISTWKPNETISLFFDRGQVVFLASDQVVTSRTLEGTYPNYSQLIPDSFSNCFEVDRKSFISSLERIAVLADQHNNVVKIENKIDLSLLKISVDAQDVGSGSESIGAKIKGDNIQIAFNVRYLLDGLKAIDCDRILLSSNAPTTPAIIEATGNSGGFIYLIMPVQIRS